MPLSPGDRFRGLLILSQLGRGAMGTAYLASHPVLRTSFVVKTFDVSQVRGDASFEEAYLAARVRSTHVVAVVDAGMEGDLPFVVQSYVDGIDLEELLERRGATGGRLGNDVVCRVGVDLARGLHALHCAGVVHCDVKPANAFLRGNGEVVLGDLGIAVDIATTKKPSGVSSGTPLYFAPERWRGAAPSRAADLYALGASLHMLATGEEPFRATSMTELGQLHVGRPYAPPHSVYPREAYLFAVLEKLLAKRPEDRHQTAEDVARALSVVTSRPPEWSRSNADYTEARIGDLSVSLVLGDLSKHSADVIVNAANAELTMNLGVAKALRAVAGPEIERDVLERAPAAMGEVVWTEAYNLHARFVAHAVSAMRGAVCIQRCVLRTLLEADVRRQRTIAFPALGTGVGEVAMDLGATLLLEAIETFATLSPLHVEHIEIVLLHEEALARWSSALRLLIA